MGERIFVRRPVCKAPWCAESAYGSDDRCLNHATGHFTFLRSPGREFEEVWVDVTYKSGRSRVETYRDDQGLAHRDDGEPASIITRHLGGPVLRKEWITHGKLDRRDGPAVVSFYESGQVSDEIFHIDDVLTRDGGPAMVRHATTGAVISELYYLDGRLSRIGGPAEIERDIRGQVSLTGYFVDGAEADDGAHAAAILRGWDAEDLRVGLRRSGFAELVDSGAPLSRFLDALAAEVLTFEGMRAVVEGAPAEWARSFEQSIPTS